MKIGDAIPTPYGDGQVILYREIDRMYQIRLISNKNSKANNNRKNTTSDDNKTITTNNNDNTFTIILYCTKDCVDECIRKVKEQEQIKRNIALNAAYVSLEQMRKFNLEIKCQEIGIPLSYVNHTVCSACLIASAPPPGSQKTTTTPPVPVPSSTSSSLSSSPVASSKQATTSKTVTSKTNINNAIDSVFSKLQPPRRPRVFNLLRKQSSSTESTSEDASSVADGSGRSSSTSTSVKMKRITKKSPPCLVCGTPCCSKHSSNEWKKHRQINMCCTCESVFGIQYIVQILSCPQKDIRYKYIAQLMDMYDRIFILLQYSSEYIPDISLALDERVTRNQVWGLGSSSAGIVSGVLGLAASATFFTPVGPPLMIASLIFGGSASAVQTGADARLHYSEPNQMADRIIALYSSLDSILRVVTTFQDALTRDQLQDYQLYNTPTIFDKDIEKDTMDIELSSSDDHDSKANTTVLLDTCQQIYEQNRVSILTGVTATRGSTAIMFAESATVLNNAASTTSSAAAAAATSSAGSTASSMAAAGKNARFFSRGGVAAASTALTFATIAGGVLSAATLILEARSINHTINTFNDGSEKAKQLRVIQRTIHQSITSSDDNDKNNNNAATINDDDDNDNGNNDRILTSETDRVSSANSNNGSDDGSQEEVLMKIPSTKELDVECHSYLSILDKRARYMTEQEVIKLLLEQSEEVLVQQNDSKHETIQEEEKKDDKEVIKSNNDKVGEENTHNMNSVSTHSSPSPSVKKSLTSLTPASSPSTSVKLTPASTLLKRIQNIKNVTETIPTTISANPTADTKTLKTVSLEDDLDESGYESDVVSLTGDGGNDTNSSHHDFDKLNNNENNHHNDDTNILNSNGSKTSKNEDGINHNSIKEDNISMIKENQVTIPIIQ